MSDEKEKGYISRNVELSSWRNHGRMNSECTECQTSNNSLYFIAIKVANMFDDVECCR